MLKICMDRKKSVIFTIVKGGGINKWFLSIMG